MNEHLLKHSQTQIFTSIEQRIPGLLDSRVSANQIVQSFRAMGITIHHDTVSAIRRGDENNTATNILKRIACADILTMGSCPQQIEDHIKYLEIAVDTREFQTARQKRYNSDGFTETVAQEIGLRAQVLRQIIKRGMLAEFALEAKHNPQLIDTSQFLAVIKQFSEAYSSPPSMANPIAANFEARPVDSVQDYFQRITELTKTSDSRRTLSVLTPYEVEFLLQYYISKRAYGRLSYFDQICLRALMESQFDIDDTVELVSTLRNQAQVRVDSKTLTIWRNTLLRSHPLSSLFFSESNEDPDEDINNE